MKTEHLNITPMQAKFIAVYDGNISEACKTIGISRSYGQKIMRNPNVIEAMKKYNEVAEVDPKTGEKSITTQSVAKYAKSREDRQTFWLDIMNDKSVDLKERLRASELLGKSQADFMERKQVQVQSQNLNINADIDIEGLQKIFDRYTDE